MTASRGMCMMQMHYFHEISRQVASIHPASEKAHSRKPTVANPATCTSFYSGQSSVTPGSCYLLVRHSHTCCEDLLRGATGCCSRVAGELVLCSLSTAQRHNATQDFVHIGAGVALSNSSGERRVENRLEHQERELPAVCEGVLLVCVGSRRRCHATFNFAHASR